MSWFSTNPKTSCQSPTFPRCGYRRLQKPPKHPCSAVFAARAPVASRSATQEVGKATAAVRRRLPAGVRAAGSSIRSSAGENGSSMCSMRSSESLGVYVPAATPVFLDEAHAPRRAMHCDHSRGCAGGSRGGIPDVSASATP